MDGRIRCAFANEMCSAQRISQWICSFEVLQPYKYVYGDLDEMRRRWLCETKYETRRHDPSRWSGVLFEMYKQQMLLFRANPTSVPNAFGYVCTWICIECAHEMISSTVDDSLCCVWYFRMAKRKNMLTNTEKIHNETVHYVITDMKH